MSEQDLCAVRQQEVKEVYNQWRQALMTIDINFLEHLFSKNYHSINPAGKCKNKSEELLWLATKNVQYLYWEDKHISIDAIGDSASVKCTQTLNVLMYDLPVKIDREVLLEFVKQENKWYLQHNSEVLLKI